MRHTKNHSTTGFALRIAMPLTLGALALAGCGDDGVEALEDGVLTVEMEDFHYGELPDEVPAGTRIDGVNKSESELHEFVAFRLPDDETRSPEDIVASPDVGELLGGSEPATVVIVPPGGDAITVVGDGTLSDPGRYLILCAIPTGADVDEYLTAAATSDGPPQVDGGPPHFVNGMVADLTVTD